MIRATALGILLMVMAALSGCVTPPPPKDYARFNAAKPRSILVVPVTNRSVDVTAAEYFLSTITIPLAEQGYYVFPVNLVKRVLEDDGMADSDMVHNAPTPRLASLFGSDAVLYITIDRWDAKYLVLTTQVTVEMSYVLKDGKTGDELWRDKQMMVYMPQSQNTGHPIGNLVAMAINAAITKAAPNYMPLAKQCNGNALRYPGPGIPPGPYMVVEK